MVLTLFKVVDMVWKAVESAYFNRCGQQDERGNTNLSLMSKRSWSFESCVSKTLLSSSKDLDLGRASISISILDVCTELSEHQ